ncbi:hypothetical protein PIB30_045610 [Stylosanthes scabra]|uniref:Aminotransferase-like plant mobile domain-containing protein n=1 Tax=Stylosanthes scabra TaxID=79078 RepID=A0ABU6SGW9_9FABA|nr:hypothetical protein [Stylosanthes scabra]
MRGKVPTSDEKEPRVLHHMRQLDLMPFREVDRVIPRFGGLQNAPHQPLNIDFLHAKDGRGSDQWWPLKYQCWYGLWASRFAQLFDVAQSDDPGSSADFFQWWFLTMMSYLIPAGPCHHLPADDIPVDATLRQSAPHPERPVVPDVPDNRRPTRRMMVGTRTTARDWQWLDEMMAEDASAVRPTQRIRRMPEGRERRRGGIGRGEGVTRHLHNRVRVVPAPVMHIMRGRAHRLTSPPPLRPRGLRSHRLLPPHRKRG